MTPVYLYSIFTDTLIIAFHMWPLLNTQVANMNSVLSAIMIFDMILKFFKAFKANQTELVNEDHDKDEKEDIKAKAKH